LAPRALPGFLRKRVPDLNDIGPLPQVIDVPAKLFLPLQVTPHPVEKTAAGTANIEIVACGEREGAKFPHGDSGLFVQRQEESIGPCPLIHALILSPSGRKGNGFILPAWWKGAKLDKMAKAVSISDVPEV
jgi:hypothetical protein